MAEGGEAGTPRWLEADLRDVWTRSDGSSLDRLTKGLERHRGDLLTEITPELTGAVLLSRPPGWCVFE